MLLPKLVWAHFLAVCLYTPAASAQTSAPSGATPPVSSQARLPLPGGARPALPLPGGRQVNVLVILVDQLNARMLGHEDNGYGGVSQSLTPNLDQLAAEGVRFANAACSSAVCQASRYSILTGRWPHNHGVRVNSIWEPRGEVTLPELARAAGYKTASIGKNHLIWANQPGSWLDDHGFELLLDQGDYGSYCMANGQLKYNSPGNMNLMPGLPTTGGFDETGFTLNPNEFHPSGYWADEVISFLGDRAGPGGDGKPFVCWYSMIGPHTPVLPSGVAPDDWAHLYHPFTNLSLPPNFDKLSTTQRLSVTQANFAALTDDEWREALSYYYGLLSQIDWNIGRVLQALEDLDLADDTLVIFTSDHGEMASEMKCWTKGAGSYDAITRVPMLMRLPGTVPAGKTVDAPVNNIDLFPTMVEATGVPIKAAVRTAVDGVSLLALMIEPAPPPGWRQETFQELGTTLTNPGRHFMVRTPTAKYASDELDGSEEFYDLAADPFEITDEFNNPDAGIQAQIADLKARFAAWWNNGLGHAPQYQPIGGSGLTLPVPPTLPSPADGELAVARDIDPTWLPCTGAAFQEVYFGANAASLPLVTTLEHMESRYNPGSLLPATQYFWRVDQVNSNGTVIGDLWSFTTQAGGAGGPRLAKFPSPAHRSSGVLLGTLLNWTVGQGTQSQDVYFGEAGDLQLAQAGIGPGQNFWQPPQLSAGSSYEWRIDEINSSGVTEGTIWTFDVSPAGLARRALPLTPEHLEQGVPSGTLLRWSSGPKAASHDVYFGSTFPLTFQGNQPQASWNPGPLPPGGVYYWRIDEVNASGTRTGWTARFSR